MWWITYFKLIEDYGSLSEAFESLSLDIELLDKLKLTKKLSESLKKIIQDKIKIPEVEVKEIAEITSEHPDGIAIIKKTLSKLQKGDIKISYVGAPKYKISVKASDYKTAEGILLQLNSDAEKMINENEGHISFSRIKWKKFWNAQNVLITR